MDLHHLFSHATANQLLPIAILYIGPETILPLTSALAAVVGVLLMGWRYVVSSLRKVWRFLLRKQ